MVVFSHFNPRSRVFVAMTLMTLAMLIIAVPIMTFGCRNQALLCIAYALGGTGVGTFDPNLLNCLTPLGKRTKLAAISAIPAGVNALLVGGFFLMAPPMYFHASTIFLLVAAMLCAGMVLMAVRIPSTVVASSQALSVDQSGLAQLLADCQKYRSWFPSMWGCCLAMVFNMACLTLFNPGVVLYVYDKPLVVLSESISWDRNYFIAAFNACGFVGGFTGRWLSYNLRLRQPPVYCCVSLLGIFVLLLWIPSVAFIGALFMMLGDGLIYGSISRYIDESIHKDFNLIAITAWLLFGDIGSIIGQNLIIPIRAWALSAS